MATTKIKPRRSALPNTPPTTANIEQYEIAMNTADKKLYTRDGSDNIITVGAGNLSGLGDVAVSSPANGQNLTYNSSTGKWQNSTAAGAGDVVGPASSTDNALARFDGTTGKLIQNSTAILTDAGALDVANLTSDYVQLDTGATTTSAVGRITWDAGEGTAVVGLVGGNVTLPVGRSNTVLVYNASGATIPKGSVVAVNGAQGQRPSVVLADADSEPLSAATLGVAAEAIAAGAEGIVSTFGIVSNLNTSAFTEGNPVYLSQTAGGLTATRPSAPAHTVFIGWVLHVGTNNGRLFININNGWEIEELHDVLVTSPANGQLLIRDQTSGVWKNASLTAGTGISVTNAAGAITLANTAPNVTTDISISHNASSVVVNSSDGADGTINAATTSLAGVMTSADKTKLDGIATGANNYTLPAATSTALGGIELFSDTVQTTAANTVTTTASRTYGIQVNSAGQAVVNVPWTDTNSGGTVTSVGGTGTVSGLTLSGTVTTSGNLTLGGTLSVTPSNFASQTANTVLAAPNGTAGTPTFRTLVAADIPIVNYSRKTANYTAVNGDLLIADTTAGTFTITLPATPSTGNYIRIADGNNWETTNLTVARNGSTIEGSAADLTLDIAGITVDIIYDGTTWEVFANTGPTELPDQSGQSGKYLTTNGSTTSWATISAGLSVSDDTTTNVDYYPAILTATSGTATSTKVSSTKLYFNPSTGQLNATNFNSLSDARYKTNITPITCAGKKIAAINGVSFNWLENNKASLGVIAQEVEQVLPELVATGSDGFKSVNYSGIIGVLIEAVKELQAEVAALKGVK